MSQLCIGCVADDFTGASDMASFLVKGGLKTEMCDGIPAKDWRPDPDTQALVIALKSRTITVAQAVSQSLACFDWLYNTLQAKQLYFKYCSTFDSTSDGNIGPVIDAVLKTLDMDNVIISPALPVNGRTVYLGHLFVNGVPIEHSSMRSHPLTPMKESNLMSLIEQQGQGKAFNITHHTLDQGSQSIKMQLQDYPGFQYLVVDHFNDAHADTIVQAFADYPFLSGSSGLAEPLARIHAQANNTEQTSSMFSGSAPTLVIAGSCSVATREQVKVFAKTHACYQVDPTALFKGDINSDTIWQWIQQQQGKPCLIYSSADPAKVSELQDTLGADLAALIEKNFAEIAQKAVKNGIQRLIIAGGETSGAVTQALDLKQFFVGPSIAPGVPVIQPRNTPELLLSLKSGNFGDADFFIKALNIMNTDTRGI